MLLTKLNIPPTSENIISRPKLWETLNSGLNRKLILVSASAGFGKTSLLSQWIKQHKIPTAWFSIDNNDNDFSDFLIYLITSIQSVKNDFGQNVVALLKSPNQPTIESVINLLINDIHLIPNDFILVLDDFHLIDNQDINKLIVYLLEHLPEKMHIVISTRQDPGFPVAKLRSKHHLVEIRSSELCFLESEISVLFNKIFKIRLSQDDIHTLELKSEGWIAGLQLAALSLQACVDKSAFIEDLAGNNRYIMDYLIEEVLKNQEYSINEFLLKTSILKQLSASLCNAVLDRNDSQLILEQLEHNNMFVFPLDNERQWYRYHQLFSDLLKQRLLLNDQLTIQQLHYKASMWFEDNKMYDLAIHHALEIKNYERSLNFISQIVEEMWINGHHSKILNYGELLPESIILSNPEFCLYFSWILISAGQLDKARTLLISAKDNLENNIKKDNLQKNISDYQIITLRKIYIACAYLSSGEENAEPVFDYCKKAEDLISDDNHLWNSWIWFLKGNAFYTSYDLSQSTKCFENALEHSKKTGNIFLISNIVFRLCDNEQQTGNYISAYKKCTDLLQFLKEKGYSQIATTEWTYSGMYIMMATCHLLWANIEKANEFITIAYNLCKSTKDISMRIPVLIVYSMILFRHGDRAEADKKTKELEEIINNNTVNPYFLYMYLSWKLFLLIEMNQLDRATGIIKEYGLRLDKKKSYIEEPGYFIYVRLLIVQNKLSEAETLLNELYAMSEVVSRIEKLIYYKVCYSIISSLRGNRKEAVNQMIGAMELASPRIYYIIFLQILILLMKLF